MSGIFLYPVTRDLANYVAPQDASATSVKSSYIHMEFQLQPGGTFQSPRRTSVIGDESVIVFDKWFKSQSGMFFLNLNAHLRIVLDNEAALESYQNRTNIIFADKVDERFRSQLIALHILRRAYDEYEPLLDQTTTLMAKLNLLRASRGE